MSISPSRIALGTACWLMISAATARAEVVDVPLRIDFPYVRALVAEALELDADGRSRLRHDECNAVSVSNLAVTGHENGLRISMAVAVDAGTRAFGRCLGLDSWQGLMTARLAPAATPDGLAITLLPEGAELRRADGSQGLLTRAATVLAENVVLPRLGQVRVNFREPLNQIDGLVEDLLPGSGPLTERTRLTDVQVDSSALSATITFEAEPRDNLAPAGEEPPLTVAELAEWQRLEDELDGFLTTVITELAQMSEDRDLRLDLLGTLIDARLAIAVALAQPDRRAEDPVRRLFLSTWDCLRPHAATLAASGVLAQDESLRLAGFVSGADAIRALDRLGDDYGIEISRDGLRRLARMLLAERAPDAFTPLPLTIDGELRELLGFPSPPGGAAIGNSNASYWLDWLLPAARADGVDPAEALRTLAPTRPDLQDYLAMVDRLLDQEIGAFLGQDHRVPEEYVSLVEPLTRATAWKESCWRHYLGRGDPPEVIRSPIGSVGIMQINQRVWRGVYDIDRLEADVRYNAAAGIEILAHYLVHYAIRRGEHQKPGGADNLVRATYAAYNGGPGQLTRYRKQDTPASLRAIDAAFWNHYQQVKSARWPDLASCYSGL